MSMRGAGTAGLVGHFHDRGFEVAAVEHGQRLRDGHARSRRRPFLQSGGCGAGSNQAGGDRCGNNQSTGADSSW
jgi:hypothetical protein